MESLLRSMGDFVDSSEMNRVPQIGLERIYDRPLAAVAAADDPLFSELKRDEVIGAHTRSPDEWLPQARAVVCYFLPFSREVRKSNAQAGLPSTEWLYGRMEGEAMNNALRQHLTRLLQEAGTQALAPVSDARFGIERNRANWSERHVAYIAGLGTFGLHASLITLAGSAGRLGSVITTMPLSATQRPYQTRDAYCVHCNACIRRCPAAAITPQGKSHPLCESYQKETVVPLYKPRYGCGKCLTAVPCESRAPGARAGRG